MGKNSYSNEFKKQIATLYQNGKSWYGNPFLDAFYVDCHFLNSTGVK
ncbi:hypothetical protein [Spiroplasma endosymbiont of 'Nebria riversi']|nr:hypothetical protein [Spiroplasma endosymbiont of 'Nebria riversi']